MVQSQVCSSDQNKMLNSQSTEVRAMELMPLFDFLMVLLAVSLLINLVVLCVWWSHIFKKSERLDSLCSMTMPMNIAQSDSPASKEMPVSMNSSASKTLQKTYSDERISSLEDAETIYFLKKGCVYHTSFTCRHLKNREVDIVHLRPCNHCKNPKKNI